MAIQKPTITHGILHNEAYWKVVQVNLNVIIKTGYITFNCYHSVIEKDINENVLTQKSYSVNSKEYDLYFNTKILNKNIDIIEQAYIYAKDKIEETKIFFDGGIDV